MSRWEDDYRYYDRTSYDFDEDDLDGPEDDLDDPEDDLDGPDTREDDLDGPEDYSDSREDDLDGQEDYLDDDPDDLYDRRDDRDDIDRSSFSRRFRPSFIVEDDDDEEEDDEDEDDEDEDREEDHRYLRNQDPTLFIKDQVRRRGLRIRLTIAAVILVIVSVLGFLYSYFKVRNVSFSGTERYTREEICQRVLTGFLGDNTLMIRLRKNTKTPEDIPFVETVELSVLNHDSISITVYEKVIAGCVSYLGNYMYFDRDGKVVETSPEKNEGVPEVTGLKFDSIVLNQPLPVDDPDIFNRILDLTQVLNKYGIMTDRIYFDTKGNASLYFGDIRVDLGQDDLTDEKISNLAEIIPQLSGKKGSIDLENYSSSTKYITFKEDKE